MKPVLLLLGFIATLQCVAYSQDEQSLFHDSRVLDSQRQIPSLSTTLRILEIAQTKAERLRGLESLNVYALLQRNGTKQDIDLITSTLRRFISMNDEDLVYASLTVVNQMGARVITEFRGELEEICLLDKKLSPKLRAMALNSLIKLPLTKPIKQILESALDGGPYELRFVAANYFSCVTGQSHKVLPILMEGLTVPQLRTQAVQALGRMGPTALSAVPALEKLLSEEIYSSSREKNVYLIEHTIKAIEER